MKILTCETPVATELLDELSVVDENRVRQIERRLEKLEQLLEKP